MQLRHICLLASVLSVSSLQAQLSWKKKFISLFIGAFFGSITCNADGGRNDCSTSLFNLSDWSQLSSPVLNCLNSHSDFVSGVGLLCQEDRVQISLLLQQYLNYKKKYDDVLAWFQSLPMSQQGHVARDKVRRAKQDWDYLGQKDKVGMLLYKSRIAYSNCSSK